MNKDSSLFKTFSADGTDGFADTSLASGLAADAPGSWLDGISSDTHAGNAAISASLDTQISVTQDPFLVSFEDSAPVIVDKPAFDSTSLDAQTSNIQDSFLGPFENGAPVIVDETAFHFPNLSAVTPMTADSTSNQHDGLKPAVADLGWSAGTGTGSNAFDAFINDAAALNLTQSNSGSGSSGNGGTSNVPGSALVTHTAASGLTINVIYDSSVSSAPAGFMTRGQCRGPVPREPVSTIRSRSRSTSAMEKLADRRWAQALLAKARHTSIPIRIRSW